MKQTDRMTKDLSLLINENWSEQREAWVQLKFKGAENEEREPFQACCR